MCIRDRVARSALKGEMVDLIHRLSNQEEEILRSELWTAIQEKRATGPLDRTGPAPGSNTTYPMRCYETAIAEFGTPRNRAEVRAFIHSARKLSSSNSNQALELRRMHELLKRGMPWTWDEKVDTEFRLARSILSTNQLELVAPPTSHGMDTRTPTNDNDYDQAHRPCTYSDQNPCLLYTSPSPRDS